ncbi:hypothetical protein M3I53_01030 [Paraburkholderia sp. CNPSo 3272]|uniref:hypothetical protein n=1 Tax=Paraburkholderia sp. CNPSo 3272 TaxID=2940931 RepID=UPI0020B65B4E|nr:hypothetical protein [Paraburkholderia sp. CNPSo 3272]MCP3721720.1 hypothetical protein [Paraburkholderia sp. CNPSo 3272]
MAAGLQIFDANGNIVLDATYRVMRIIGAQNLSLGQAGSVTDDRFLQGGWASFQPSVMTGQGYLSGGVIAPRFSISGNVLSWSYAAKNNSTYDIYQDGILFYGAS